MAAEFTVEIHDWTPAWADEFRQRAPTLRRAEAPGPRRCHVHVRRAGSWNEQWALLFRDYLRAHRRVAAEYEAVKRMLAAQHRDDRHAYTHAKGDFLWATIRRADLWAGDTGWRPGPSDA
jgi:GrpB-like predicted nucleotidyltransferase (UPF0157 family)